MSQRAAVSSFRDVPRRNRVRFADSDVAGIEVQRFRRGSWLLFVWETGKQGCPLIGARVTKEERARLVRLLGGTP